jgi:hypothetical protein
MPTFARADLDRATLEHVVRLLEHRLSAVATYGAGGCPTCHDAELRGAIALLRRLQEPAELERSSVAVAAKGRRGP